MGTSVEPFQTIHTFSFSKLILCSCDQIDLPLAVWLKHKSKANFLIIAELFLGLQAAPH